MEQRIPSREEMQKALELRHTKEVQDRLTEAHVAICGLGGLGSAIAFSLARAGIGHLHLIDFDHVDLTNLNRQQYALEEIGMPKPEALLREIRRFAPYLDIQIDFIKLTEKNIVDILSEDGFICEAFDSPEQKAMLTNTVLEKLPECFLVGASGMAGYESSNTIVTRKVTSHFYLCGDEKTEITEHYGLMAPRVMICAAHQSNMILRLILGQKEV